MQDKLGVTFAPVAGVEPIPVYEAVGGVPVEEHTGPYVISDGRSLEAPLPVVDAGGPTWTASDGSLQGSLAVEGISPPVPPPVPGPLDYIEPGHGLSNITVEYDLARPVAMLGIAFRHDGTVTALTATHGGEPLEMVGFSLNDVDNIGAASFIGNGLTIEPANLVITPVGGGTIGPAVIRIDDSFAIDEVEVGSVGEQFGYSYINSSTQPALIPFTPVSGNGWGVYALACSSAEKESFAIGYRGASPVEQLFWGVASSGTLVDLPPWQTIGTGWVDDGEWWEHSGSTGSHLIGQNFPSPITNPFWYEVEVDIPEGGRLDMQVVLGAGVLNEIFKGPLTGTFRRYRNQNATIFSARVAGYGEGKFRNFRICGDGQTVFGAFGRTVNPVPENSALQFRIGALSRFAGVTMEVHEK